MKKIFLIIFLFNALQAGAQTAADSLKQRITDSIKIKSQTPRGVSGSNLADRMQEIVEFADTKTADTGRLATKFDMSSYIQPLKVATMNNQRYDNAQLVKETDGYYRVYCTRFDSAASDLSASSISYVESKSIYGPWSAVQTAIPQSWVIGAKTISNQSIAYRTDGTEVMTFIASYSTVLNFDSLRTRYFRSTKAPGQDSWSMPTEIFNGNDYTIGRANSITIVRPGYWVMPYTVLDSGDGNSTSSRYYGGFFKSYDEGQTWIRGARIIKNGNNSVDEISLLKDQDTNYHAVFRTVVGQIQEVLLGKDTSFNNVSSVYSVTASQNALSSCLYYAPRNLYFIAATRWQGYNSAPNRRYSDLYVSPDFISFTQFDNIDFVANGAQLNEHYLYLDTSNATDPILVVLYSKTGVGNTLWSLYMKTFHINSITAIRPQTTGAIDINQITNKDFGSSHFIRFFSKRATPDSAHVSLYNISSSTSADATEFGLGIDITSPNIHQAWFSRINSIPKATGFILSGNMGKYKPVLQIKSDSSKSSDSVVFSAGTEGTVIATSTPGADAQRANYGAVFVNADNGQLGWKNAGVTSYATQNFLFPLGAGNFAADSSYTDAFLAGKYITVQDTSGKYLRNGRDYTVSAAGKLKLISRAAPSSTDTLYVHVENLYKAGRVPTVLPMDTLGTSFGLFSFHKLRSAYTGYCVRLKSTVTGEVKNFGFGYEGYLDTFAVKAWPYWDSCTVDDWYDQSATFSGLIPANATLPKFRLRGGIAYVEFNGSGLVANTSTTRTTLAFLHQAQSTISIVGEVNNVTTSSAYGLIGTNQGTNSQFGCYSYYDNRSSQSKTNALVVAYANGTATATQSLNNSGITPNNRFIVTALADLTNATPSLRSSVYINNASVQQNNNSSGSVSSTIASTSLAIGSVGSNASPLTGKIFEVIITNAQLTTAQRNNLRNNQNSRFQVY